MTKINLRKVADIYGFLLAQEFAKVAPKDTGLMSKSFPGTFKVIDGQNGLLIRFVTPFYTEFVINGTAKMKARNFILKTINEKGKEFLKQAIRLSRKIV